LGQKLQYSKIDTSSKSESVKQLLELLEKARIIHRIYASAANGVPLGAQIKDNYFKEIFLDVGLCSTVLNLDLNHLDHANDLLMVNNGGMAEQVVGQLLRTINPFYIDARLYCWHRDEKGSNAEIDYVIQHGRK